MKRLGLLAFCFVGCTHVVWLGHSDDRRHEVQVVEHGGGQFVRVDGEEGPRTRGIPVETVFVDALGRPSYVAQVAEGWVVFSGTTASRPWPAIGELVAAKDGQLAYTAGSRGGWVVVANGVEHPPVGSVRSLSRHGDRWVWIGVVRGKEQVFIDGKPMPAVDGVTLLSSNAGQLSWVGREGGQAFVFVEGVRRPDPWAEISELSSKVLVARSVDGGWQLQVDGRLLEETKVREVAAGDAGVAFVTADDAGVFVHSATERRGPFETVARGLRVHPSGAPVFAAEDREGWTVYGPGWQSGPWVDVDGLQLAGTHVGFIGVRAATDHVVVDGVERSAWAKATSLALAPDGERVAFLATRDGGTRFVAKDELPIDLALEGTVAFSESQAACIAGSRADRQLFFLFEDGARQPLELEEVVAAAMRSPRDQDERLRRWVRAELTKRGAHDAGRE